MQLPTEEAEAYTNVADSFTDGEHVTYRRTRERTHGGLRERPLTPDLLHHPSLTYDTCSTSFSISFQPAEYTYGHVDIHLLSLGFYIYIWVCFGVPHLFTV